MQNHEIVAGPDRFKLATRLFDGNSREQLAVVFTIIENRSKWDEHIKLASAQREDGSGDCWSLTGYNTANHAYVTIYYNLRSRSGTMTFGKTPGQK